jgi:8-oxo-dGTP pyrophosphatase MutT (NUDIX family)/predicted dehydrogenase
MLIGLGPHAKRIYLSFLSHENLIDKVTIVDLDTERERIQRILSQINLNYDLLLLNNRVRNMQKLPTEYEKQLLDVVEQNNIKKVIISTEPRSHKMYINFCLKYGLDIMCDKPITTPLYTNTFVGARQIKTDYEELVDAFEYSKSEMFEIQTQRRAHQGYLKIKEMINDVVKKYHVPITKITISHCDGNWSMPSETVFRENHPYKYGYGKLMHSGYHFLDLLSFFLEINQQNGLNFDHKEVQSSDYRPSDFYTFYGRSYNEGLNFYDKIDYYDNLDVVRNFGEFDISAIIDYKDSEDHIMTTAHLELSQSGFSRRSWFMLPEDTYKGNGRVRHEFVNISVGPLLNIKVLSFQATEISEGGITDTNAGGLDHFDILVFRNSEIIGGSPYEKINLTSDEKEDYYIGQNETARFDILRDFFTSRKSYSNITQHEEAISLLSELHANMARRYPADNFRFAVEVIIKYNDLFLICKRNDDLKVAPGIWNIPAGKVKHGEGLEEAILRETLEETNLILDNVEYLDYKFINQKHKRVVYTYFSEVSSISEFKLDINEFSDWKWVSAAELDQYETLSAKIQEWIRKLDTRMVS